MSQVYRVRPWHWTNSHQADHLKNNMNKSGDGLDGREGGCILKDEWNKNQIRISFPSEVVEKPQRVPASHWLYHTATPLLPSGLSICRSWVQISERSEFILRHCHSVLVIAIYLLWNVFFCLFCCNLASDLNKASWDLNISTEFRDLYLHIPMHLPSLMISSSDNRLFISPLLTGQTGTIPLARSIPQHWNT